MRDRGYGAAAVEAPLYGYLSCEPLYLEVGSESCSCPALEHRACGGTAPAAGMRDTYRVRSRRLAQRVKVLKYDGVRLQKPL